MLKYASKVLLPFTWFLGETKSNQEKSQGNQDFFKSNNLRTLMQFNFSYWLFSNLTEHN